MVRSPPGPLSGRHLFQANVARQILDHGATPSEAVKTVESQLPADPKKAEFYEVPKTFLAEFYPAGEQRTPEDQRRAATAQATKAFADVARRNGIAPEQLSTHLKGGLETAVKSAPSGVPRDVPRAQAPHAPLVTSSSDETPYEGWKSNHFTREAMCYLLFPSYHSKVPKRSPEYQATENAISRGGDDGGLTTTSGSAVIGAYGEYSDWAMKKDGRGVPSKPAPEALAATLGKATQLEGAPAGDVKFALAKRMQTGAVPVLVPLQVAGHQTYVSFEQHPTNPDRVIMRYYDRQRPDLNLEKGGQRINIEGYLGPGPEFKARQSTELCFEVDKKKVLEGDFVDTMLSQAKSVPDNSKARLAMLSALTRESERVYLDPKSRPQMAQSGSAINCTWASFESFLSHVHGDQYKTAVAGMREYIVSEHVVGTGGGFAPETREVVRQGLEQVISKTPSGPALEVLKDAKKKLDGMKT
jgi:hypothetical protein